MLELPNKNLIIETETIERLNDENLLKLSDEEVMKELLNFKNLALIVTKIRKGDYIYRVRIQDQEEHPEKRYKNKCHFNYRTDVDKIMEYGRGNLPRNSMFYGSVYATGSIENIKVHMTAYMEVSSILHNYQDTSRKHEFFYTSKWQVKEDFEVVAIINHEKFQKNNEPAKYLASKYNEFAKELKEDASNLNLMINYIAEQYAREVKKDENWKYKISANYTQYLLSKGITGVLYPSVKTEGESFNIVMPPDKADELLNLTGVALSESHTIGKKSLIGHCLFGRIDNIGNVIWRDVAPKEKLENTHVKRFYKEHGQIY